ncbi:hypothetical protein SC206_19075 [Rouxiella sp. T17]|uniref:hypothetical protein n=1 Tax=Rouxiella sp. T17 TaxID=3085684 RepID=UPI002FCAEAFD
MPISLFQYLYVFDAIIEPQGPKVDQLRHAQQMEAMYKSSGNLTEQGMKSLSIENFDYAGLITGKSTEERSNDHKKTIHKNIMSIFPQAELSTGKDTDDKNKDVK